MSEGESAGAKAPRGTARQHRKYPVVHPRNARAACEPTFTLVTSVVARLPPMPAPIEIQGLSKRFGKDVLAVDRLDLTVEEGQIFGLLGPNGAGKTTTLRMLVGLVRPTAGGSRLFGDVVKPGARALRRVGTLVESPGFVPHLSGLKNLELFWRAGGQHIDEADLDGALEVADLGRAINRKVKTYSHGMKQRLGIAQALLGKPDLLILDEPTTGLDPQQMREMRLLIHSIANRGAT